MPVKIELEDELVYENYITIGGNSTEAGTPYPYVKIGLDVDIMGLSDGGLKEIMDSRSDCKKKMDQRRYDYGRAHGIYGEQAKKDFLSSMNPSLAELKEKISKIKVLGKEGVSLEDACNKIGVPIEDFSDLDLLVRDLENETL